MAHQISAAAEIEQVMGAKVTFDPIWDAHKGSYDAFYASVADKELRVFHAVDGATREQASEALLEHLRNVRAELFTHHAIAAE